jgi:hypothetical protein
LRLKPLLKWCFSFAGNARKRKTPFYPAALAAKPHAKWEMLFIFIVNDE